MKIVFSLVLFLSMNLHAQEINFNCVIDYSVPGETYNKEQADQLMRSFDFKYEDGKPGKQISFKDINVFVWSKDGNVYLKLKFQDQKELITYYGKDQQKILMKWGSDRELVCNQGVPAVSQEADAVLNTAVRADTDLKDVKGDLVVEILQPFTFIHDQKAVIGRMRPVVFQQGKTYTGDDRISKQIARCHFMAQMEFDQDIEMEMGQKWQVKSKNYYSNDDRSEVLTFDFVGSSGRISQKTAMLTPMNLECAYPKGISFRISDFKQIVGPYMTITRP